jgi:hypothetical protein
LRRRGWATTARFVRSITHCGTRLFCSHAFASLILKPFVDLLI